jgi:hypothetical protein
MTRKEKIEYAAFAVLVVAIGCILYFYMFKPQPAAPVPTVGMVGFPAPAGTTPVLATPAAPTSGTPPLTSTVPAGSSGGSSGGILPYGTQLQTSILTNPLFVSLVPPVYPQVTRDEVGNPNPFAQPAPPTQTTGQ